MTFHYGMVIGMDYLPPLRLMVVAPIDRGGGRLDEQWSAVVLHDEPHDDDEDMGVWARGTVISVSPSTTGITLIESDEDVR